MNQESEKLPIAEDQTSAEKISAKVPAPETKVSAEATIPAPEKTTSTEKVAPETPTEKAAVEKAPVEKLIAEKTTPEAKVSAAKKPTSAKKPPAPTKPKVERILSGTVVSNSRHKTIAVLIETRVRHQLYKKYITRSRKVHAHDAENQCNLGDLVRVIEAKPYSKTKHWNLLEVVEQSAAID